VARAGESGKIPSREPSAQPPSAVTVTANRVARRSLASEISLSGSAVGKKTVRLGFMVAGKIDLIAAHECDPVRAGQLLARLDSLTYRLAFDIADAAFHQATDEHRRHVRRAIGRRGAR